jgi:hypothetical protein
MGLEAITHAKSWRRKFKCLEHHQTADAAHRLLTPTRLREKKRSFGYFLKYRVSIAQFRITYQVMFAQSKQSRHVRLFSKLPAILQF